MRKLSANGSCPSDGHTAGPDESSEAERLAIDSETTLALIPRLRS
jgi:hypothetical protein